MLGEEKEYMKQLKPVLLFGVVMKTEKNSIWGKK
jgi:hypothetical protein